MEEVKTIKFSLLIQSEKSEKYASKCMFKLIMLIKWETKYPTDPTIHPKPTT